MLLASDNATPAQGLCVTCARYPECERCHEEDIFYCDRFVDPSSPAIPAIAESEPHIEQQSPDEDRLMGLCVSCERRSYCTNARTLGGVWVCEEYL